MNSRNQTPDITTIAKGTKVIINDGFTHSEWTVDGLETNRYGNSLRLVNENGKNEWIRCFAKHGIGAYLA